MHLLTQLYNDERGTTTIEYAMICGGIVLAILGALSGVADKTNDMWAQVGEKVSTAQNGSAP
ncbi:MAG: Flp family type IVb pilin [Novosphingobium sp.]|jgi:Flp pilus assembly pilin Flp|nr:Flp family type IVb pilin [Novosphingobium sp.]